MQLYEIIDVIINVVDELKELLTELYNYVTSRN